MGEDDVRWLRRCWQSRHLRMHTIAAFDPIRICAAAAMSAPLPVSRSSRPEVAALRVCPSRPK